MLKQFLFDRFVALPHVPTLDRHGNDVLLVKAQLFILNVIQLVVDDRRTDEQGNRNRILKDDERLSQ